VVTGTSAPSTEETEFRGAPEVGSLFVYNVTKDTTADHVRHFLERKKIPTVSVRVLSTVPARYYKVL
jgi:hypothetical protein